MQRRGLQPGHRDGGPPRAIDHALAAAGVGIGFIASETQRLTREGVVYLPADRGPGPHLDIGVAYHTDEAAPLVQTFLAVAREAGVNMR